MHQRGNRLFEGEIKDLLEAPTYPMTMLRRTLGSFAGGISIPGN